jgi:large subunit ribosomal protein L3
MTRLFQADGRHVPVTVLQLDDVQVVGRRERIATAIRRRAARRRQGQGEERSPSRSAAFGKAKVEPKAKVAEFRVAEDALLDVGATSAPTISSPASWSTSPASPRARALPER